MRRLLFIVALSSAVLAAIPAETAAAAATCHGHRATIVKGDKRNIIIGTKRRDVIFAGGGNDVVWGKGGDDLICGGPGRDALDGQRGRDPLYGGRGPDLCVASQEAEHVLHHQCEIHPTRPKAHPHAHAASTGEIARVAQVTQCASSLCVYGGVPVCSYFNRTIDLASNPPQVTMPYDGYVQAAALLEHLYTGQYSFTPVGQTNQLTGGTTYNITLRDAVQNVPSDQWGIWEFFRFSRDGQNWTDWMWVNVAGYQSSEFVGDTGMCQT